MHETALNVLVSNNNQQIIAQNRHYEKTITSPLKGDDNQENDFLDSNNDDHLDDSNSVDTVSYESVKDRENSSGQSMCSSNSSNNILMKAKRHIDSGLWEILHNQSEYKAGVDLLAISKKAGFSVNTFDAIVKWAKNVLISIMSIFQILALHKKRHLN